MRVAMISYAVPCYASRCHALPGSALALRFISVRCHAFALPRVATGDPALFFDCTLSAVAAGLFYSK